MRRRARALCNNPTEPEIRLWNALRGKQLEGYKFRRQAVLGQRIVDFYCPAARLVVEVDGDTHDPKTDALRDRKMQANFGVRVMRFTNGDVMQNLDGVLMRLVDALGASNHPPTPSLSKERERLAKAAFSPMPPES